MDIKGSIMDALSELTNDGTFNLERIDYDENNFGNICVLLSSDNNFSIRFIKDKGVFWGEVGQAGDWYFIEDVLNLLGSSAENKCDMFTDYMSKTSNLIRLNMSLISHAFNSTESQEIQNRIKELATKRALGMLK